MNEMTEACIRGCAMYREHLTDCDGMTESGRECNGCLPRRATHGHLCHTCHRRIELMLTDAPIVDNWLTGNLATGGNSGESEKVTGSKEMPLPIRTGIYDERQAIRDTLAVTADDVAEQLGVKGPLAHTVAADAKFLLVWLTSVERLEPIGDWWDELAEHTSNAHALAPWRPVAKRIPRTPCPRCEETNLVIYGGDSDVTCQSCKSMMSENQFWIWENVLSAKESVG